MMSSSMTGIGLVNIDMNDLLDLTKDASGFDMMIVEAKNIAKEIEKALKNYAKVEAGVFVHITASKAESNMDEINKIGETVANHFSNESKIMWGAEIEDKRKITKVALLVFRKKVNAG